MFSFISNPSFPTLYVWIHDHKTLGKDKLLGSAEINVRFGCSGRYDEGSLSAQIWRHIKQTGPMSADVDVELTEGEGLLKLRLEYDPEDSPLRKSTSSGRLATSDSILSPSRFSLSRRRTAAERDD